jgi:hypothetical protein
MNADSNVNPWPVGKDPPALPHSPYVPFDPSVSLYVATMRSWPRRR